MKRVLFLSVLFLMGASVFAQNEGIYSIDHIDGLWNTDTLKIDTPVVLYIRVENNTGFSATGITNGFQIYSPDGANWTNTVPAETGAINSSHFEQTFINTFSVTGTGADTVAFSGFRIFAPGLPDGFNEIAYTITLGPISAASHKKTICIDTSFFPPAGIWKWSTTGGDKFPFFGGPYCFTVFDPSAPSESNLILTPDSLHFSGTAGASSPAPQAFTVSSDGSPLAFDLVEDADWIVPTPITGTTSRTINVQLNTIGMSPGYYQDTITVTSADATNSPQYEVISLDLVEPPPVISVSPGAFYFNAIAGGSNPADKFMTIANTGGQTLNWTVSNSSGWLSLAPMSGTDSGNVTLSVDITGLGYDTYYDTVVVSDPSASNDPVLVPVTLSVSSDLPIIAIDTTFRVVTVPLPTSTIPPRTFTITNGGAGNLTFSLSESSPRILTLTPSSGSAPQQVSVDFKVTSGSDGDSYFDTVWVSSPEAINSPVPVVFNLVFTSNPPQVLATTDTIRFTLFECDMGANVYMPEKFFSVNQIGGDSALKVYLQYDSDLFWLDYDSGYAPMFIKVTPFDTQWPLGTYYDTIVVNAPVAINSPDTVIVKLTMSAGIQQPEIYLSKNSYTIPTQENSGPSPEAVVEILNRFGGCMEWSVVDSIPWMYPLVTSGNVPGSMDFNVNSSGYPFGEYLDSFLVVAPEATNTPQNIAVKMRVWRFHGDWDYNAEINIVDLVMNVSYLFSDGPLPQPEKVVGDLDCDHDIDITDLTFFVAYMWGGGPIPCGNPYK